MNIWLKLIGSADRPITEHPFYGCYKEDVGFRKERRPGIRKGDHLFIYAPGGSRRVFALAEAISDPEHDRNFNPQQKGSCMWKLRVQYLISLPVSSGILIDEITTSHRNLIHSIRRQSHIKLLPEEYKLAYSKLQKKAAE